ncbi:MAG: hypothetical protein NWR72_07655 [Bacteroidia bacterium]|nr:hypothetical protein [Bacteroidia bacterium]
MNVLLAVSGSLRAQEVAPTQKLQIRPMLDLHGVFVTAPWNNLNYWYYARVATGVMLNSHWGVAGHLTAEGRNMTYRYRRHMAVGLTLTYQQKRWMASADVGQLVGFKDWVEGPAGYSWLYKGFSPSYRLLVGVRVAPRFVVGATACWDPAINMEGTVYENGNVLYVRTMTRYFYPNLFFGLSLPTLLETRKKGYKIIRQGKFPKS